LSFLTHQECLQIFLRSQGCLEPKKVEKHCPICTQHLAWLCQKHMRYYRAFDTKFAELPSTLIVHRTRDYAQILPPVLCIITPVKSVRIFKHKSCSSKVGEIDPGKKEDQCLRLLIVSCQHVIEIDSCSHFHQIFLSNFLANFFFAD
jgi:hypothetical protein